MECGDLKPEYRLSLLVAHFHPRNKPHSFPSRDRSGDIAEVFRQKNPRLIHDLELRDSRSPSTETILVDAFGGNRSESPIIEHRSAKLPHDLLLGFDHDQSRRRSERYGIYYLRISECEEVLSVSISHLHRSFLSLSLESTDSRLEKEIRVSLKTINNDFIIGENEK
ncbi:hypothetical protein Dimus_036986 [Dionaea muscipula]